MNEVPNPVRQGVTQVYDGVNDAIEGDSANYHFGSEFATEALAGKLSELQVGADSRMIDLCCGWGGASQYLAQRFGCEVTGVDINARSVDRARALARGTPAERLVSFVQADALSLTFCDAVFAAIWSQDGFCHIPDHSRLLNECYRVLRPNGHLVFTDFLKGEYLTPKELESLSEVWHFPSLETNDDYLRLLVEAGFEVVSAEDVGREYVVHDESKGMEGGQPTFLQGIAQASHDAGLQVELHGKERYIASTQLATMVLYIAQGKLGIGRFVCTKKT